MKIPETYVVTTTDFKSKWPKTKREIIDQIIKIGDRYIGEPITDKLKCEMIYSITTYLEALVHVGIIPVHLLKDTQELIQLSDDIYNVSIQMPENLTKWFEDGPDEPF